MDSSGAAQADLPGGTLDEAGMTPEHLATLAALAMTLGLVAVVQQLARGATGALVRRFGWLAVPWTTGWLGVPIHEMSHALACLATGRRIRAVQLFAPNERDGSMGSVTYETGPHIIGWLSGCVIGLAPLAGGTGALFGLAWLVAHAADVPLPTPQFDAVAAGDSPFIAWATAHADFTAAAGRRLAQAANVLWHQGGWQRAAAVAWCYASACVAAHLVPSRVDVASAWRGALLLLLVSAAVVYVLLQFQPSGLALAESAVRAVCAWVAAGLTLAAAWLAGFWMLAAAFSRLVPVR